MILTRSEDFVLQTEVSAVTEGSVMDVSTEMKVETTGHSLMTSTPQKKEPVEDISAQNAENHMCRKGTWSATGKNTTNWMMDLVSLVHSVIRNLSARTMDGSVKVVSPRHCPATSALRNCCFNCCAWTESQGQCPLHCCRATT